MPRNAETGAASNTAPTERDVMILVLPKLLSALICHMPHFIMPLVPNLYVDMFHLNRHKIIAMNYCQQKNHTPFAAVAATTSRLSGVMVLE